ncbi:10610_t:CDS:2, partial [Funneliformis caledonium]
NTNIDIETLEDVFILDENQDNLADANNNKKQSMLFYWKENREISYLSSILDSQIKKFDFAPYEMEWTLYSLKEKYDDMKF